MSEARNTETVKECYAAFQRGDIATILSKLDDTVEWEGVKGTEGVAPHAGVRRGRAAVTEFFQLVGSTLEFHAFEPKEFIAQGDTVVAIGSYRATVKPTKKSIASDWTMIFNFRDGKITRFREFTDSAQVVRAYGAAVAV
jgi:ketosteroid isomerase-like protein